jgi:type VI secretion system protein ImpA
MPEQTPGQAQIDAWLTPLDGADGPAGLDLEYDNDFLELLKAAQGVPETQFSPAELPNWRTVRDLAEVLLDRTRDLRVALVWIRADIALSGFIAIANGITLLDGLLRGFWDHLHPMPDADDGDTYARANALAMLPQSEGLLGDLRQSLLFQLRGVGELRVRAVEVSLGLVAAKTNESTPSKDQLIEMVAVANAQDPLLRVQLVAALQGLAELNTLMREKLGALNAPDVQPLVALVKSVLGLFPVLQDSVDSPDADEETGAEVGGAPVAKASPQGQLSGRVTSREDALRAINMVCDYLDSAEPGNPAQLLLRRASRLINQNFLQLMKELAPDALNEVAKLMGVDPEDVN